MLAVLTALALCASATAFNVDTSGYIKHRGSPGSMFGFSVAVHREKGNSWVLVGAPEAETSQPGVTKGGAVFRCDIGRDDACVQIDFDLKGNNNSSDERQVDEKSYQWFGATVRSSGESGIILACAPRYVWFSTRLGRRDPVGTCYTARNQFTEFAEYSPCRTRNWGHHKQGSCQAGLGASLSKDGKRMYVGAVGSWYWQGQLHSLDSGATLPWLPPLVMTSHEGQVVSQSSHARPDVLSTGEGPSTDDDSYLGYSVASGDFGGGSGGLQDVVVGMPRGDGLKGRIVMYSWNLTNLHNRTGEQLGAYFGYSIAAGDLDGDGKDDIIVGAPLYTAPADRLRYETGRVYMLYQGTDPEYAFMRLDVRDGVNSKGRFGLSVAYLADINMDGYGDIAVGAPYDGPNGRGAVYIYHGSAKGLRQKESQIITAEQVSGQPTTFGFSLAGGLDLDENLYPDLVVGAYESDTAVFLRSRPVVRVDASLNFISSLKQIGLEERNCTLRDKTRVACIDVNTCLKYNGTGVASRIEFEIQFVLDSKKQRNPRMFFRSDEGRNIVNQTLRLDRGQQTCQRTSVYISPDIRDKLTPLEVEMRYSLKRSQASAVQWRVSRYLSPVLDMDVEAVRRDALVVRKNCGADNVCIPDLRLVATPSVKKYLLGSRDNLVIDVIVQNEGEDAYEATFELEVPQGLNFVKVERGDDLKEVPVLCSPPSYLNNNTLHCDIGNPLPRQKLVKFGIVLQPKRLEVAQPRYEFRLSVNSTNPERQGALADNGLRLTIPIWVETDLIIKGSTESVVYYNASQFTETEVTHESQIGPQVIHVYSIANQGPSDILEAEAYFLWPSYTLSGDHLLYLLEQPEVNGNAKCEVVEEVNVNNIKLERRSKGQALDGSTSSLVGEGSAHRHSSSSSGSWSSDRGHGTSWNRTSSSTSSSGGRTEERVSGSRQTWSESSRGGSGGSRGTSDEGYRVSASTYNQGRGSGSGSSGGSRVTGGGYSGSSGGSVTSEGSYSSSSSSGGARETDYRGSSSSSSGGRVSGSRGSSSGGSSGGTRVYEETYRSSSGGSSESRGSAGGSRGTENGYRESESAGGRGTADNRGTSSGGVRVYEESYRTSTGGGRVEQDQHRGSSSGGTRVTDESHRGSSHSSSSGVSVTEDGYRGYQGGSSSGGVRVTDESYRGSSGGRGSEEGIRTSHGGSSSSQGGSRGSEERHRWRDSGERHGAGSGERHGAGSGDEHIVRGQWGNGGDRTSYEERTYEKNTTWGSGRKPQVSTSWSVNQDGAVSSGHSVHDGDSSENDGSGYEDRHNHRNVSWSLTGEEGLGGSRVHISLDGDNTLTGSDKSRGGSFYSEERTSSRNESWASGTRPVVHESTHWEVNKDGEVTSGGHRATHSSGGHSTQHASGGHSSGGHSTQHSSGGHSTQHSSGGHSTQQSSGGHSGGGGQSSHHSSGSSTQNGSTMHSHSSATSLDIGDLLKKQGVQIGQESGSGGFDFGAVAQGPRDGIANTYTLDIGMLDSEAGGGRRRDGEARWESSSGRRDGEAHWQSSGGRQDGEARRESSGGSRTDGGTRWESSGGSRTDGGTRWESSGGSRTEGGTRWESSGGGRREGGARWESSGSGGGSRNEDSTWKSGSRSWSFSGSSDTSQRNRRQVDDMVDLEKSLNCGPTKCIRIRCVVGPLKKDEEALFSFRSKVWVRTLPKEEPLNVSSVVVARVSKLPHIGRPDVTATKRYEVLTQILPRASPRKADVVPLWVVVLSACAGALLLMLLVFLLYKCGFFKRNRPSTSPEKQPLNRNGHYHSGDEAL